MRATVDRPGLDSQGRSPLIKIRRVRKGDLSKVRDVIEQSFSDFFERQTGTRPPRFSIQVNSRQRLTRDYAYFVENRLRDHYALEGIPLVIDFVERKQRRRGE